MMAKKAKELAIHDKDTGSSEVQVAQLTDKIENLSKHIKQFKKDKHSSVGLIKAVNKRKKLLDYLKKNKSDAPKRDPTPYNLYCFNLARIRRTWCYCHLIYLLPLFTQQNQDYQRKNSTT